jgi:hypothetical protein
MNQPCTASLNAAAGVGLRFAKAGAGLLQVAPPGATVRRGRER